MDTTGSFASFFGSSVLPRSFAHIPVLAIDFALALALALALDFAVAHVSCSFLSSLLRFSSSICFFPTVLSGPLLIRFIGSWASGLHGVWRVCAACTRRLAHSRTQERLWPHLCGNGCPKRAFWVPKSDEKVQKMRTCFLTGKVDLEW